MRKLLTDDEVLQQLRRDIVAPRADVGGYASEVWNTIVVPGGDSSVPNEGRRR